MAGYDYSLFLNTEVPSEATLEAGPGKAAEMQGGQWVGPCTSNHTTNLEGNDR